MKCTDISVAIEKAVDSGQLLFFRSETKCGRAIIEGTFKVTRDMDTGERPECSRSKLRISVVCH